jgi:hypothetical protein
VGLGQDLVGGLVLTRGWQRGDANCLKSNSPGEREGWGCVVLAGAAGGSGFRRGQSSDKEETCGGHVSNGSKNCWLRLYVLS